MVAVYVLVSVLCYLASMVMVARAWYQHVRPYTEPLSCHGHVDVYVRGRHVHSVECYRRPGSMIDGKAEAMAYALLMGLSGPAGLLVMGLTKFIKGKPLPEEIDAKLKRLEVEDRKWRKDNDIDNR